MFDKRVPEQYAEVTHRLKEAGAVLIGKTNLHTSSPWRHLRHQLFRAGAQPVVARPESRGSSGGSAAAVSAGLFMLRRAWNRYRPLHPHPRRFWGIAGLKLTYGLVSIRGIIPLTLPLDHCGPITGTVEDAALLLNALAVTTS